jgi:hypothetical protein
LAKFPNTSDKISFKASAKFTEVGAGATSSVLLGKYKLEYKTEDRKVNIWG